MEEGAPGVGTLLMPTEEEDGRAKASGAIDTFLGGPDGETVSGVVASDSMVTCLE